MKKNKARNLHGTKGEGKQEDSEFKRRVIEQFSGTSLSLCEKFFQELKRAKIASF